MNRLEAVCSSNKQLIASIARIIACVQTVGRYSYRVRSGGHLLPNRAGLDPLTAPSAFNAALKVDLEQLFIPSSQPGTPEVHSPHASLLQAPFMAISGGLLAYLYHEEHFQRPWHKGAKSASAVQMSSPQACLNL